MKTLTAQAVPDAETPCVKSASGKTLTCSGNQDDGPITAVPKLTNVSAITRLDLAEQAIVRIEEDVFEGWTALHTLDLRDNEVDSIHPNAWSGDPPPGSLRELSLHGNRLGASIAVGAFLPPTLEVLDLGGRSQGVSQLTAQSFSGLPALLTLRLEGYTALRRIELNFLSGPASAKYPSLDTLQLAMDSSRQTNASTCSIDQGVVRCVCAATADTSVPPLGPGFNDATGDYGCVQFPAVAAPPRVAGGPAEENGTVSVAFEVSTAPSLHPQESLVQVVLVAADDSAPLADFKVCCTGNAPACLAADRRRRESCDNATFLEDVEVAGGQTYRVATECTNRAGTTRGISSVPVVVPPLDSGTGAIGYVVGFTMGGLLILLLLLLLVMRRRSHKQLVKLQTELADANDRVMARLDSLLTPSMRPLGAAPMKDLERKPYAITRMEQIGSGAFGIVYKAMLDGRAVAMKEMKAVTDVKKREDFILEATLTSSLKHDNVVRVTGVCLRRAPLWMSLEYMRLGAANVYLKRYREAAVSQRTEVVDAAVLLHACQQVCSAMVYLSSLGILHRDLAARNVLVGDSLSQGAVKLADFGLARSLASGEADEKVPWKWMAPESLDQQQYSQRSDIWSFGVVMWELFSFGRPPYANMSNVDAALDIHKGHRLPRPPMCPPCVYIIMEQCWMFRCSLRPTFAQLAVLLEEARAPVAMGPQAAGPAYGRQAWHSFDQTNEGERYAPFDSLPGSRASTLSKRFPDSDRRTKAAYQSFGAGHATEAPPVSSAVAPVDSNYFPHALPIATPSRTESCV